AGGADVAAARLAMLGTDGLDAACETLAQAGFLARFVPPADPRFAPVAPPPGWRPDRSRSSAPVRWRWRWRCSARPTGRCAWRPGRPRRTPAPTRPRS